MTFRARVSALPKALKPWFR